MLENSKRFWRPCSLVFEERILRIDKYETSITQLKTNHFKYYATHNTLIYTNTDTDYNL